MNYTCWFADTEGTDLSLVGGKGANLSRLAGAGFPVPPGFCITAKAYSFLLHVTGLRKVIYDLTTAIDFQDQKEIAGLAAEIRDLIEQQPIPEEIAEEILQGYRLLGKRMNCRHLEAAPVAVRSSATAEDLPEASFAGQQDTYLNVRGDKSLLEFVRRCWASLWTERALIYRWRHGIDHQQVEIAVVVQAMVNPRMSGILFTANPLTGAREECVINASWGLGEAIVSGLVNPDTLVVDKRDGRILRQEIAAKRRRITFSSFAGAVEEDVPIGLQQISVLQPEQAAQLAALATRIEQAFEVPQDIEWAHQAGSWYILQARPITSLPAGREATTKRGTFSRAMFTEIFTDGLSPAFLSVVCPLLENMLRCAFIGLGFRQLPDTQAVHVIKNQPYLSVDFIEETLADLDPQTRALLTAKFTDIFAEDAQEQTISLMELQMAARLFIFVRRFRKSVPALLSSYRHEINGLNKIDLAVVSDRELLDRIRQICYDGAGRLLNNDFLMIAATGISRTLLRRLLLPAYGDQTDERINNLLGSVSGNVVMESNKLIWNLAQQARREPAVLQQLQDHEPRAALAALRKLSEAHDFLKQLDNLLQICGHREQHLDICYPTWGEDPAPVIGFVRSYLKPGYTADPLRRESELIACREQETARVLEALSASLLDRLLRRPLFNCLLEQTQWLLRERDTMHFEWTRLFPAVRRMEFEIGSRLQQRNILDRAEDIFFLRLEEQEHLIDFPRPCQELVRRRRQAYEANLCGPWALLIRDGAAPGLEEGSGEQNLDSGILTGIGGSAGFAAGPVCVISGPETFPKLQPGDILVAQATNPVCTPLFALAGGIVTEVGGMLSHGAIVAREYGIPAVMSVAGATDLLVDGQVVAVDGNTGKVILEWAQDLTPHNSAQIHTRVAD